MNDSDNFWLGICVGAAAAILVLATPAVGILESRVAGLRGEAVKRNHAEWNRRSGDRHDHLRLETPARGSHHAFGNRTP